MAARHVPGPTPEERLGRILDEYFKIRGMRPGVEEYAARHPDLAGEIRSLLPSLVALGADRVPVADAVETPRRIGGFKVIRELGRGGMGIVYEAEQIAVGRRVALKVLPVQAVLDRPFLERFRREARAAANLHHPHIVPVHEVGEVDGVHFYTMQYVDGVSLDVLLEDARAAFGNGDEPARESESSSLDALVPDSSDRGAYFRAVARIGLDVARALDYAHGHGVLHRDVKPSNLLLDSDGKVWVTDFGLCKAEGSESLTQTGALLGTLRYMAPERLRGESDARSDVYGLGCTLYELITLSPAFPGSDHVRLLRRIEEREPVRPARLAPDVPGDLEAIVLEAMQKDPAARYRSAGALARDLEAFLQGRPIAAKSPSVTHLLWLAARRHKAISATVAVALLTLLLLTSVYVRDLARERRAAQWQSYVARIGAIETALRSNDLTSARKNLELAPEEHRGWEWQHYSARLHEGRDSTELGRDAGRSVAWTPDGTMLAVADGNGVVLVDREGQRIRSFASEAWVIGVDVSPDGAWLAAGSTDGVTRIWRLEGGEIVHELRGHTGEVTSVQFDADGGRLATGSGDFTARIWDTGTGECLDTLGGHRGAVADVAFGSTARLLATAGADGTIRIWRLDGSAPTVLAGHVAFTTVDFGGGDAWLVSGSIDGVVQVWDVASGRELRRLTGHRDGVASVACDDTGTLIASASADGSVRLWEVTPGQLRSDPMGHCDRVWDVAWAPDGHELASTSWDGSLKLWSPFVRGAVVGLRGTIGRCKRVAIDGDGITLYSGGDDGLVRVWDLDTGFERLTLAGHSGPINGLLLDPGGERLLSADEHGHLVAWDVPSGERSEAWDLGPEAILGLDLGPDRRTVACTSPTGVTLLDLRTGSLRRVFEPDAPVSDAARFLPDGERLVLVLGQDRLEVLDLGSGQTTELVGHRDVIRQVEIDPTRGLILSISWDGSIRFWDLETLRPAGELPGHLGRLNTIALHPDGSRLAVGSTDGRLKLWSMPGREEVTTMDFGAEWSHDLAFSSDGTCLVMACDDGTIWILRDAPSRIPGERIREETVLRRELTPVVRALFAQGGGQEEVLRELERRDLSAAERGAARALAATWKGRRETYLAETLSLLREPGRNAEDYRRAKARADAVTAGRADSGAMLTLRGLGYYRTGDFAMAISAVERARMLKGVEDTEDLALLALAHGQAGHAEEARDAVERLERHLDEHPEERERPCTLLEELRHAPGPGNG